MSGPDGPQGCLHDWHIPPGITGPFQEHLVCRRCGEGFGDANRAPHVYTAGYRDGWDGGYRWGLVAAASMLPDGLMKEQLRGLAGIARLHTVGAVDFTDPKA